MHQTPIKIPISFDLEEKCYIQTRFGVQKADISAGKIQGHNKSLLPHLKPEKTAKTLSQLLSNTTSKNQPQTPKMFPSEEE